MELIQNGSFDRPRSLDPYWTIHPDDSLTRVQCTDGHSGRCCLWFRSRGEGSDPYYIEQDLPPSVVATGDLTLWAKGDHVGDGYYGGILVILEYPRVTDRIERHVYSSSPDWMPVDPIPTRRSRYLRRVRIEPLTSHDLRIDDVSLQGAIMPRRRGFEGIDFRLPAQPESAVPYSAPEEDYPMIQEPLLTVVQLLEDRLFGIENQMAQLVHLTLTRQQQNSEKQGASATQTEGKPEQA